MVSSLADSCKHEHREQLKAQISTLSNEQIRGKSDINPICIFMKRFSDQVPTVLVTGWISVANTPLLHCSFSSCPVHLSLHIHLL